MNITELARQVRIPTTKLREILPELGFDIGARAIKVDDKVAQNIIDKLNTPEVRKKHLKTDDKQPATNDEKKPAQKIQANGDSLQVGETIVVKDLASQMKMPVTKLVVELMKNGVMASLNQSIDFETAAIIAEDLGFQVKKDVGTSRDLSAQDFERQKQERQKYFADDEKNLKPRPPIITIMGHVDHGKTKLLDAIRATNVVDSEAGGITQHIGAYEIEKNGQQITFIDTPGHEAFSAMRSRGAQVADIAILVVAADDGVQPQTIEAISHIRSANLPFIIAINKIDKAEANIDKLKSELAELDLTPEDWGGQTISVEISAKQKINIDGLLDTLLLVYQMESKKITANPQRPAVGTIIESHLDKGEGPVATVLIQTGTLHKSDAVKIGNVLGKIKIMKDWQSKLVAAAPPSMPVKIIGLKSVPEVGEILQVVEDTKTLKKEIRKSKIYKPVSETLRRDVKTPQKKEADEEIEIPKLNIILKSDVVGSQEAVLEALNALQQSDLMLNLVHCGLGDITEGDIEKAEGQNAVLIGFNVKCTKQAELVTRDKSIAIKTSRIIYELLDYIKGEMNKMFVDEIKTEVIGKLKVLKIFRTEKDSQIIGGKVIQGKATTDVKLNIMRNDEIIATAELEQLQSAKQDVTEVLLDQEAGMKITGFNQVQEGDIIEVIKEEKIKREI